MGSIVCPQKIKQIEMPLKNDENNQENYDEYFILSPSRELIDKIKNNNQRFNQEICTEMILDDFEDGPTKKLLRNYKKTSHDINFISNILKNHFALYHLNDEQVEILIERIAFCEVGPHEIIFKAGESANNFYIIKKGSCEIVVDDQVQKIIEAGKCFGEKAILYDVPRSASVRTREFSQIFVVERIFFKNAIFDIRNQVYEKIKDFIQENRLFDYLDEYQKDSISGLMILEKFAPNEYILYETEGHSAFFLIKEGNVALYKGKIEIGRISSGDYFAEDSLDYNITQSIYSVKAIDNVKCFAIPVCNLIEVIGDMIYKIRFEKTIKSKLLKSKNKNEHNRIEIKKIIEKLEIKQYKNEYVSIQKFKNFEYFIFCLEGNFYEQNKNNNILTNLNPDVIYGEELYFGISDKYILLNVESNIIVFDGIFGFLNFSVYSKIMNYNSYYDKKEQKRVFIDKNNYLEGMKIEDLIFIKSFDQGILGPVYLVKSDKTHKLFVLKCISKASALEKNLEKHVLQEKDVLEKSSHPFIIKLSNCINESNSIFFLLEYVRGIELFDYIRDIGLLPKRICQFYVATIVLIIEYLHTNSIVYRDLKPENLLIDDFGFLKLIDFGAAKCLIRNQVAKTYTIVGTPHYMAPEIVTGKGYSFAVDLWSLGVLMYEFLCGGLPFAEDLEDPYEIYEHIIKKPLIFPGFLKDNDSKNLMTQLINKVSDLRLGGSYENIKNHKWFEGISWTKLLKKEIKPPYVPEEDKLLSIKEINKIGNEREKITDILKNDEEFNRIKYRKEKARNPNWDKQF